MRDLEAYQKIRDRIHDEYVKQLEAARITFGVTEEEAEEIEEEESQDSSNLPLFAASEASSLAVVNPAKKARRKRQTFSDMAREGISKMSRQFKLGDLMEELIKMNSRFERRRASTGTFLWRSAASGKLVKIVQRDAGASGNTYEKL